MSQSTRSDSSSQGHGHSHESAQAPLQDVDVALQQVTAERNSLRSQNDQLWKIIEKQRIIIQNLQKDLAKAVAERDLLRSHFSSESTSFRSDNFSSTNSIASDLMPAAKTSGYQQHVRHTSERKTSRDKDSPQQDRLNVSSTLEIDSQGAKVTSLSSAPSLYTPEEDKNLGNGQEVVHPGEKLATTGSLTLDRQNHAQTSLHLDPAESATNTPAPVRRDYAPAITDGNIDSQSEEQRPFQDTTNDPEQKSTLILNTSHQAVSFTSPTLAIENDLPPGQYRSSSSSSAATSPTNSRNVSGNLTYALSLPHMPHLPPRSPRRERRDIGDNMSPAVSDNEDEAAQTSSPSRVRGATKVTGDHHSAYSTNSLKQPLQSLPLESQGHDDEFIISATKVTGLYVNEAPSSADNAIGKATRKNISAQIPSISSVGLEWPKGSMELGLVSSSTAISSVATPASPIAAIIDQDAEKFRIYMDKLNNPNRRNVSAPIQAAGSKQDLASALGQAVAMENIQQQLEIQNQLLVQVQSHGGRGLKQTARNHNNISAPILLHESTSKHSMEHGDGSDQGALADAMENNNSQLSLPSDIRSRKRDSSLHLTDELPKILSRSALQQHNDEDASLTDFTMPVLPRRYDSQNLLEQSPDHDSTRPRRVASPTPSGNSSLVNALTSVQPSQSQSRSAPTYHQQAFSMFADNLEFVSVLVVGSNINANDRGKEQLTFFISIGQEVQNSPEGMCPHKESDELWRVEKQYTDFVNLDAKLRVTQSRNIINSLPKLPEKSLFNNHAPSKVDARKIALEQYLQQITSLRIKDTRDLCEFLSTNVVEREIAPLSRDARWKEGYLTKRGKNFGGWKTRYFMLRGPVLEYLDAKDGHHLGSISLTNAQIGRQQTQERSQENTKDGVIDPNSYRHAFLILEPKKGQSVIDAKKNPNNVIRHVLCAETDQERDQWVDALMLYVGKELGDSTGGTDRDRTRKKSSDDQKSISAPKDLTSKGSEKILYSQDSYDTQARSISSSVLNQPAGGRGGGLPQSPTIQSGPFDDRQSTERPSTEGQPAPTSKGCNNVSVTQQLPRNPTAQSSPQDDQSLEGLSGSPVLTSGDPAEKKQKSRMTFWPKKKEESPPAMPGTAPSASNAQNLPTSSPSQPPQDSSRLKYFLGKTSSSSGAGAGSSASNILPPSAPGSVSYPPLAPIRQIFGVPLEQAIEQARVLSGYQLPAVVYRCIEYLNAHRAKMEEGIYRLNGSSAVIKNLKERFNHEGDVQLLASEDYYDIHAVAGLLKLYLRDLPSSVLTRELHKDFLQVVELSSREDRVNELTRLVASLPEANYTILRALTAHLIEIVDNADVNKMTARNVGIVFSPTLGIPAGVFSLLMSDFNQIFHAGDGRIMPLENSDIHGHTIAQDANLDNTPQNE
ncbi:RalA-binding protein 1 [Entomortierella parvispora]|uniref:RalA-binding protein 1 n=1 Tax=Entomortierella parvispora TaxID=205924 RepID=A0A9P3HKU8_9FUNG|nr:RalA-binding protein 1 [Entomortierella parvispora]